MSRISTCEKVPKILFAQQADTCFTYYSRKSNVKCQFLDHMQGNFSVVCKFPCTLHCFRYHECVTLKKTLIPYVQFCKGQDGSLQSLGKSNHRLETFASCFWTHGNMNIYESYLPKLAY